MLELSEQPTNTLERHPVELIEIEVATSVNPFSADIQALAVMTDGNPKAAGQFIIEDSEVGKAKYKIAKAANDIDLTAALASATPGKTKGTTVLVYRLKPRHKTGPRKTADFAPVEETPVDEYAE